MNEPLLQLFAFIGGSTIVVLLIALLCWLMAWIPSRASKLQVYDEVVRVRKEVRNEARGWYSQLSQRVAMLENAAENAAKDKPVAAESSGSTT